MPSARRSTGASASSTPSRLLKSSTPQAHHHRSADELALEEASDVVHEVQEEQATPDQLLSSRARSDTDTDDDAEEAELERLFAAAKASATKAATGLISKSSIENSNALGENDDGELRLDSDQPKETPIPDISIPKLPARHLSLADDGTAFAGEADAGPSESRAAPTLDRGKYERTLSKREKKAQPKKASESELWVTIPSPRDDDLPQMRKDYQALHLSHTLDPKRFMKGGNKAGRAPERFQIGTMVDAPRQLQATTLRKEYKYRPGQIITNVVGDAEAGTYAKRKFEELQSKRIFNGRGKGWQKRAKCCGVWIHRHHLHCIGLSAEA
ncbi:hypothetical protein CspeluHIS016_0103430 [Cutaneotrichosporon spelunceum]|uniref:Fcf2 pre-rRNA processing C-terminal domain-containing protein n=1 Tax=Cutaneotrichosporon spelunceum TaxID=1672016 RepID=A0AAD3TNR9_9TREE|nr:hypothetical protein CspeluHIS016_0103430 [Cutaneotrichosporon spelunceum]